MHTLICEGFGGFYSSVELIFISWRRRYFLVEKILIMIVFYEILSL